MHISRIQVPTPKKLLDHDERLADVMTAEPVTSSCAIQLAKADSVVDSVDDKRQSVLCAAGYVIVMMVESDSAITCMCESWD